MAAADEPDCWWVDVAEVVALRASLEEARARGVPAR
jgi:hypothetical protein